MEPILSIKSLQVKYNQKEVIKNISLTLEEGQIYSIIGPNGSGKTTLLRAMSRNLKPNSGQVLLRGKDLFKLNSKKIAQQMAVLSQVNHGMLDVTIGELVLYGRYASKSWWKGNSSEDQKITEWALKRTGLTSMKDRRLKSLSGGERQRAWIAMAIAQRPQILLFDEPTTYLDISHQLEVLELIEGLNRQEGITIVMVLHDINHAVSYSHKLIILKEGTIYRQGSPQEILQGDILQEVFQVRAQIIQNSETGIPIFHPRRAIKN